MYNVQQLTDAENIGSSRASRQYAAIPAVCLCLCLVPGCANAMLRWEVGVVGIVTGCLPCGLVSH